MYSKRNNIYLCLIISLVDFSFGRKQLPSYVTKCKYSLDKVELGNCILKTFEKSRKEIEKGIPQLHVPVIDPYFLDEVNFSIGQSDSAINLQATLKNVSMRGTAKIVLANITLDLEHSEMTGYTYFKHFDISSSYKMNGKILIVPLDSIGNADIALTDVYTYDKYSGKKVMRNGKEYIDFRDGEADVNIAGTANINFDNLINGNPQLTDSTNKVLNDNINDLKMELNKIIAGTITQVRLTFLQAIFGLIPLEDLFEK